jgi:glycosyltransferase involved in cell wall biosynthesis
MADAPEEEVVAGKLRVVLVSANLRPSIGGIERFTELLAGGLVRQGHRVTVVGCRSDGAPAHEHLHGIEIERIPASQVLHRRVDVAYPLPEPVTMVHRLRRLLRQADVVHVQDALYLTSAAALLLANRMRVASVLTQHAGFVPQKSRVLDVVESGAARAIGRCARLADVAVAFNPAVAEWANGMWGVDVRSAPVGVPDHPPPAQDRALIRRSFGLPDDRLLALFVGRDVPTKGLDRFLAAGSENVELVAVTNRAPSQAPGARVLPFMAPERLSELLRCVDAFCLPSVSEGFPLALQEALVAGLPCVLTRVPGFERFLRDGEALFVSGDAEAFRDALALLAVDDELRASLAARARAAGLREFRFERVVRAYEGIYAEAIERNSASARHRYRPRRWRRDRQPRHR